MNFSKGRIREFYLLTTDVENIFINEYMPAAPGEFVKVYLYGLMYAQQGMEMSHEGLARQLHLSEDQLNDAWNYWAEMGAVKKTRNDEGGKLGYDVEYINLRELMYGNHSIESETVQDKPAVEKIAENEMANISLKEMLADIEKISGKMLSPKETQEIYSWVKELKAKPDIICYAWQYCYSKGKTNVKYIEKVVIQWTEDGYENVDAVKEHLGNLDQKYTTQMRILQALGLNRGASEAEKQLIDTWIDKMGFSMDRILEACGTTVSIPNPNLAYVNKVLENWHKEASAEDRDVNKKVTVTQAVLNKYMDYLRKKEEKEAQERKTEIYMSIPRVEAIDREIGLLSSSISRNLLSGRNKSVIAESRKQMAALEEERAVIMTENNYPIDYTDIRYSCEICKDTGITDSGTRCSCIKKRIEEAEVWQKKN